MNRILIILFFFISFYGCQKREALTFYDHIFEEGSDAFQDIINQKDKYEIQILISPIERKGDSVIITDHFYNFKEREYFYPASSVKMPVAFLALQKLQDLRSSGIVIDRNTALRIDSLRIPQKSVVTDTTAIDGKPTIGHYIEKIFAVSDNDAYNRLFEFLGQDYINADLRRKEIFKASRIVHRVGVSGFDAIENRHSPSFTFYSDDGQPLYNQRELIAQGIHLTPLSGTKRGVGRMDDEGVVINEPFDFTEKNFVNIKELQESLVRLIFPELYPPMFQYGISNEDRQFLISTMAKTPSQHPYLSDKGDEYYDSYVKFFMFGDSKLPIPPHIKIHNKVGYAYGYLTDCAYIQDTEKGIDFFITATIYVNENQIFNDGVYEYDTIGIPFLAELGRLTYEVLTK